MILGKIKDCSFVLYQSFRNFILNDGMELSGYLAFLAIISIFPTAIFFTKLFSIVQYFVDKDQAIQLFNESIRGIDNFLVEQMRIELEEIIAGPSKTLINISIVSIIWTASSTTQSLKFMMNKAYKIQSEYHYIISRFLSVIQFSILSFVTLLVVLMFKFLPNAIIYLNNRIQNQYLHFIDEGFLLIFKEYKSIINIIIVLCYIIWINVSFPNKKLTIKNVLPGAIFILIGWIVSSIILSVYFSNFTQFSLIYGSLSKIVSVLLYFYVMFICFGWGVELNAILLSRSKKIDN